jgi:hypothetical protein
MKRSIPFLAIPTLALAVFAVSGCEKPVVVPVQPVVVQVPVAVPGPAGPAGATGSQGNDGAKGEPGKSGSTVIVLPTEPAPTPAPVPPKG